MGKQGKGRGKDEAESTIMLPRKIRWKLDFVRNLDI
jgi:hypothetical protein